MHELLEELEAHAEAMTLRARDRQETIDANVVLAYAQRIRDAASHAEAA